MGNRKAKRLSLLIEPAKSAIAICGAKPIGLLSQTLYRAQARISINNTSKFDLFSFIYKEG
jgi:hypothetical protein